MVLESFDTGSVTINLGPWITLTGETTLNADAADDEPFLELRTASATFTEDVPEVLASKGIEAGGFGLGRDGTVYLLADDPETPEYDGARFSLKDNSVEGNLFGRPDWLPIRISELGLQFHGFEDADDDGSPDNFDISIDSALSGGAVPLLDPSNYSFVGTGGLPGEEGGWPITGRVKELVIDVGNIMTFLEKLTTRGRPATRFRRPGWPRPGERPAAGTHLRRLPVHAPRHPRIVAKFPKNSTTSTPMVWSPRSMPCT